jgi:hypothetical protein
MNAVEYYTTTLTTAFSKIGPVIIFGIIGYFLFFKLPFLLILRNMKKAKAEIKVKAVKASKKESLEKRKEVLETPKESLSPEELFDLKVGQKFTKEELRKKYHDLIRMNHPDKVANLSQDFKVLADKKTKSINEAYSQLMKRAS